MKKFLATFILIVAFIIFANSTRKNSLATNTVSQPISDSTASGTTTPDSTSQSSPPASSSSPSSSTGSSNSSPSSSSSSGGSAATPSGKFKNGSFTGSSADAYYGNVQVKAVISNGKISDVQFLDHPSGRNQSMMINNYAMPILKREAIQAQSANVDTVSGATMTSGAFVQSLQSALDKAAI